MATLTSQLVVSLLDKVSGPARAVANSLRGMGQAVVEGNRGLTFQTRLDAAISRTRASLDNARMGMFDAVAMGYALKRAVSAPIMAAVDFESAMADVRKVVDFPTPQSFIDMQNAIKEMSYRLPKSATDIAAITAAAGQAGMAGDELLKFAEMATKVSVAFDMTAAETGDSLAKIKTALGLTVEDTRALADAMNHLSNTSASAAPDLIAFMRKTGSAGTQYGFTAVQTAAIGSAMVSAGFDAQVAGTSFLAMGRALTKGAAATKGQKEAFEQLGLKATDVAANMQKDAVGTLNDVLARVRALPEESQAAVLSMLFGDLSRAIAPLVENADLLKESLEAVSDETKYLGSSEKEYAARAATTANNIQLFKNRLMGLAITIGSVLLPPLNEMMKRFGELATRLSELAAQYPNLTRNVVAAASAFVAFRIATAAMKFLFFFGKLGALETLAHGFGALATAGKIAGAGLAAVAAPLGAIGGLLTGGVIIAGIGALAVGGVFIARNWRGIKSMFAGIGRSFMDALGPQNAAVVRGWGKSIASAFGKAARAAWNFLEKITGPLPEASWRNFGNAIGQSLGEAARALIELPERARGFAAQFGAQWDKLADKVKTRAGEIKKSWAELTFETAKEKVSGVGAEIGASLQQTFSRIAADAAAGIANLKASWDGLSFAGIADKFRGVGNEISAALSQTAERIGTDFPALKSMFDGVLPALQSKWSEITGWLSGLTIADVSATLSGTGARIAASLGDVVPALQVKWAEITNWLSGLSLPEISATLAGAGEKVAASLDGVIPALQAKWDQVTAWLSGLSLSGISASLSGTGAKIAASLGDVVPALQAKWTEITAFVSGLSLGDLSSAGSAAMDTLTSGFKSGWDALRAWFDQLGADIKAALASINLYDAGVRIMNSLFEGVKAVGARIKGYIGGLWSGLKGAVGMGGGGAAAPAAPRAGGPRASGGPVLPDRAYLVGERGPEIFQPGQLGTIKPNQASAGAAGPAAMTVNVPVTLNYTGKGDPNELIEMVRRVMRDEVREAFRGVLSDTGMRFA